MAGPAGAARPRGLPAPGLSLASLPPLPSAPAAAPELLPAPPRSGPRALPRLTPRDLRSGLEMQLAEKGKALPGRRPSPSREMSAMGGRGALPGPADARPEPEAGSQAWNRVSGPRRLVLSVIWHPQREISLRGVKSDFFAPRSLMMLQVRQGWGEGWRAAPVCPQRSSQMTTLENEPGSHPRVLGTCTRCSSLPSIVVQRRSPAILVLLSKAPDSVR